MTYLGFVTLVGNCQILVGFCQIWVRSGFVKYGRRICHIWGARRVGIGSLEFVKYGLGFVKYGLGRGLSNMGAGFVTYGGHGG